ncbi:unnamed protein product, partial [Closterium sp. NIES-54]
MCLDGMSFRGAFKRFVQKKKPSAGAYPLMKPVGPDGALPHYTREELTAATSNWTQKIGEGGFGTVYKGYLRSDGSSRIGGISSSSSNGKSGSVGNSVGAGGGGEGGAGGEGGEGGEVLVPVAVKMCTSGIKDSGREQLMTEVMVMTAVQHPYILRLLGVATLGETLAMVSEFVPNGDVDLLLERALGETLAMVSEFVPHGDVDLLLERGERGESLEEETPFLAMVSEFVPHGDVDLQLER